MARDESDVVTSGFATRQRTCRPAAPTHPQKRRDRYFRYNGEFSTKKKEVEEREKGGGRKREGERENERVGG